MFFRVFWASFEWFFGGFELVLGVFMGKVWGYNCLLRVDLF